jgi:hypothetical protein
MTWFRRNINLIGILQAVLHLLQCMHSAFLPVCPWLAASLSLAGFLAAPGWQPLLNTIFNFTNLLLLI